MKTLKLSLAALLFTSISFAAAPSSREYAFEKKITIPSLAQQTPTGVLLDDQVLRYTKDDFSNFQLLNARNEEVPFVLFDKENGKVKDMEVVRTSSKKQGTPESALVDNDILTTFAFDEKVDRENDSWVIIDLGAPRFIHQLNIFPASDSRIHSFSVKTGNNPEDLKTFIGKKGFNNPRNIKKVIDFNSKEIRYVKVSFWGTNIKLDDLIIYATKSATIYFDAIPGESYRILYGNPSVNSIRYKDRISEPREVQLQAKMQSQKQNPIAPKDFDEDEINNTEDNCPYIKNKSQKDTDGDKIGDPCDNAVENKNYSQSDVDNDGVGDIIDNCKRAENPDQADKDNDGFGDACDNAYAKDEEWEKENPTEDTTPSAGLLGGFLALLAVAIIGMFIGRKKK